MTKHQQGFTVVHPSSLPLTCSLRTGTGALGLSPELHTRLSQTQPRMSGRGQVLNTDPDYVFDISRPPRRCHSFTCDFTSQPRFAPVSDTSRQGNRYHNRRFAALAHEMGLATGSKPAGPDGYTDTTLTAATRTDYADELAAVDGARLAYLHDPTLILTIGNDGDGDEGEQGAGDESGSGEDGDGGTRAGRRVKITCGCGRGGLQVTPAALDEGPIVCGVCGAPFAPEDRELGAGDPFET